MTAHCTAVRHDDQPLPPVPEGAVMVTLKISAVQPGDRLTASTGRPSRSRLCPPTGCSTCCST